MTQSDHDVVAMSCVLQIQPSDNVVAQPSYNVVTTSVCPLGDCMSPCFQSSCGLECRRCNEKPCSVKYACGGEYGTTVQFQSPYTCPDGDDAHQVPNLDLSAMKESEYTACCEGNCVVYIDEDKTIPVSLGIGWVFVILALAV